MNIYRFQHGERHPYASLWEALGLQEEFHKVISYVGAGGKTSLMIAMAKEAAEKGYRVIVTTSTKIFVPETYQVVFANEVEEIGRVIWRENLLVAGQKFSDEKLRGLPLDEIEKLTEYADILLVEADGARRLPLKFPGVDEPVLVPKTQAVVSCAGLDSIGTRFADSCFRYEMAERILGKNQEDKVSCEDVAAVLWRTDCGKKSVGERIYCPVLNKMDLVSEEIADRTASLVENNLNIPCALVSFIGKKVQNR